MVARLVGPLAFFCFSVATATEPARKFSDDEVSGTQRYFAEALRDNLNKGKTDYCDTAYLEDASMQVSLGPIASDPFIVEMGLRNPAVFRGRANITNFWRTLFEVGKVKDLKAYDDKAEYAASSFVIDDDTLILESPFANNKFQGHIFSETWVRVDKEWKLLSQMIAVQKKIANLGEVAVAATTTEEKKSWLPGFLGGSSDKSEIATTTTPEVTETTEAKEHTEEPPAEQLTQTPEEHLHSASGFSKTFWMIIGVAVMAAGGFFLRHHRMRRDQSTIARFDSMLG